MLLLLRLVLLLLIVRAVLIFVRGAISGAKGEPKIGPAGGVQLMRDPVCGVYVSPETALTLRSGSGTAYFCSEKCRQAWRES